jgi:8-oxo-dGTP pyrophosphatase MutT (NUDIX family)
MQLLRFRKRPDDSIRIVVHLDDTKVTEDGAPDPAWIYEATWPPKPANMTAQAYGDMVKREAKLLAQAQLAELQDEDTDDQGTALAGEGATL